MPLQLPFPRRANPRTAQGYVNNRTTHHLRVGRQNFTPGQLVTLTPQGTFARPQIPIVAASTSNVDDVVTLFTIKAIAAGALTCRETYVIQADGTFGEGDEDVTVLMPVYMSQPGTGLTYTGPQARTKSVTVDSITGTVDETIEPAYTAGDRIVAAFVGVDGIEESTGVPLEKYWLDLNADGRVWQERERIVNVCVNLNGVPTTRKMVVRGGAPFA